MRFVREREGINGSSEHRPPVFLMQVASILLAAAKGIRRIRKRDGETLPMLARLMKWMMIQHEPRMAIEIEDFFSHTRMKENRMPQSSGEPIECQ